MRFIHTSDWHIGRQFHHVSLLDDQRQMLQQITDLLQKEACDALVIAGDLYDRSVPPATAVELMDQVFHQISDELGIPVLLIPGNHDSSERLRFAARQLRQAGLYIFGDLKAVTAPVSITGKSGISVDFYGVPYHDPEQVRLQYDTDAIKSHNDAHNFLLEQINGAANADNNRVLISHCFVDGAQTTESERPLSIGGADRVDYQPMETFHYVALGHLHSPQHRGEPHIRYSGSPLKYSFSEVNQKKGVTLVEFTEDGNVVHKHLPLTARRDMRIVEGAFDDIIRDAANDPGKEDYLMVRLTDQHAILDAMGKLRSHYPNVLHLEKPGLMNADGPANLARDQLKRSEMSMFADFYQQTTGNDLTDDQQNTLESLITGLHKHQE